MYAARLGIPHTVDVYDSSTWRRLREIPTPCCSATEFSPHTLQVTDDHILVCCFDEDELHVLSHSGELLQTTSGEPMNAPGVLRSPYLCQVDAEGSVLVADKANDRLQVMAADGTWSVVDLDQTVTHPMGAVWYKMSLYILIRVANDTKIVTFSQ